MDLQYYKQTDLEKRINKKYQEAGLLYPSDLTIENVAAVFGVEVHYYDGRAVADWQDGEYAFVLLNAYQKLEKRREEFFHELGHPELHCGNQGELSKLFVDLQERQAAHFQLYAAMPVYMLEEFWNVSGAALPKVLTEEFVLPEPFVRKRLEQIIKRIYQGQQEHEQRERLKAPPVKVDKEHVRRVIEEWKQNRGIIHA